MRTPLLQRSRETHDSDFRIRPEVVRKVAVTMAGDNNGVSRNTCIGDGRDRCMAGLTSSNGNAQGEGTMVPARGAKPAGGFKTLEKGVVETDLQYVGSMIKAYTTSQSLAVEIETEIPLFVTKARQRIMSLIQVIGQLRKELYDAKQQVITVNQRLHTVLTMQDLKVDFAEWEKDLEESIMKAESPEDIKEAMDKAEETIAQNGAAKG
ncbi:hypothetical protein MAPG_05536, partial [Magnaporthiopsis poae ATCC 64411]